MFFVYQAARKCVVMSEFVNSLCHLRMLYFCSTTENLTIFIWDELKSALRHSSVSVFEVAVHETEKNSFSYRGEYS